MFALLPVARSVSYTFPNNVYVFGSNAPSTNIHRYNGTTVTQDSATMPNTLMRQAAAALNPADIYMFGGQLGGFSDGNATANIYKFTGLACVVSSTLVGPVSNTNVTVVSSVAFIFGGRSSGGATQTSIQRFNGSTTSTDTAVLDNPNSGVTGEGSAASVIGSNSFIFAGIQPAVPTYLSGIQRYTGSVRTTDSATLATPLCYPAAATLSSIAYIFGGSTDNSTQTFSSAIQTYNGSTAGTAGVSLADAIGYEACSVLGSDIFVFGGSNHSSWSNLIQRFNGSTRTTDSATLFKAQNSAAATVTQVNVFMV